jgi:PAS domain S-box-containing protein
VIADMDSNPNRRRRQVLIFLLALVVALFFLGWSQASLNLTFIRPSSAAETIFLLALSAVIFLAFVIFALILLRILLKLYVERRQARLGSRFKTKMVVAFLGLSLLPVCFLFAFAYGLLNRSLDKWFGIPFDVVRENARQIVEQLEDSTKARALHSATLLAEDAELVRALRQKQAAALERALHRQVTDLSLVSAICFDSRGRAVARAGEPWPEPSELARSFPGLVSGPAPFPGVSIPWRLGIVEFFLAARFIDNRQGKRLGTILSVVQVPVRIKQAADEIQQQAQKYDALSRKSKAVKRADLTLLGLLTLLILFVATWIALFISKQVTVPIQALAEATHEVSGGNLEFQISARADDELGSLIHSFNEMTRQLLENRRAIDQAARKLQRANREMEAILTNIPTGVISFDEQRQITQVNSTVERMFGRERVKSARSLADLFSAEDAREIARLFRRAARQGAVTQQMDLDLATRHASVALTLTSIRTPHGTAGSVLVIEDLTEMLRAQKAAAWQEVARRIAHEIKNPLTPIRLSTERIQRLAARQGSQPLSQDLLVSVAESASLIDREVATLKTLVDEFSNFARFPASRPVPSCLNTIVENALNVFDGRLKGIEVHRELQPDLPAIPADPEQMKRVVINLIDNAAEALEQSMHKEIWIRTHLDADRDVVELMVADSGPGIPPEAKEQIFLPYFSTKRLGTGLGLAIVSRIVSEHSGWIRVEENRPTGTKFVIELPVERAAAPNAE